MGSNFNITEGRQSNEKVILDSETLYRLSKMQKIRPQQEDCSEEMIQSISSGEMIPSISNHRCGPNSRLTSPTSIRKKLGSQGQDLQSSPRMKVVEVAASLVSATANKNFEFFQERNENTGVRLEHQDQSNSFAPENLDTMNDIGTKYTSPEVAQNQAQQDHTTSKYDDTFAPMIIDTGDDIAIGGCPAKYECDVSSGSVVFAPRQQSPTIEQNIKVFCPHRRPRRSSMKASEGTHAPSPSSERRASIQPRAEKYQVLLPGQSEPVERQRSIAFDDDIDIQSIEPIRLLSAGGPQSLWYQENEYETIKFKTLALLDRVDHSSGVVDGKKYCTRGLEKFMSPEANEVKKHQAWDSVLNEQFLQRKDGEFDEETLANIYMYSTKRSRVEACRRAKIDAEASEAYLKTKFRRHSSFQDQGTAQTRNFDRRVSL